MPVCGMCSKDLADCKCDDHRSRSRSQERRETERKEQERKQREREGTPVKDLTDLLNRLNVKAEAREQQNKEELVKIIEDNDEKWKKRLDEDRKELLRIQDEKTTALLKESEAKTAKEFEKIWKEISDVKKHDVDQNTGRGGAQRQKTAKKASTPFEERVAYTLGNLGFNTKGSTIEERARDVLAKTSLPAPKDIQACFKYGSSCRITFSAAQDVWTSRYCVKDLKIVYPEQTIAAKTERGEQNVRRDGEVWLDVKKTYDELSPGKVVRKAEAAVCKHLHEVGCQKEVEGCLRAKKVYVGGKSVGYTFHGVWYWEATAATDMACDASALQSLADKINAL